VFDEDRFRVLRGHRFFRDGVITFPSCAVPYRDKSYRTVFGGFSTNSVVYAKTNTGSAKAAWRLLAVRFVNGNPGDPYAVRSVTHKALFQAQSVFIINHRAAFESVASLMRPFFEGYTNMDEELRAHHADPHPKVKARINAYNQLIQDGTWCSPLWLEEVLYKPKGQEQAKPRKKIRGIGDMGVAASLQGFRLMHFFKVALSSVKIPHLGGIIWFCKSPTPDLMIDAFDNLINLKHRFFLVLFSDDAVISYRDHGGSVITANLDISSCDASHGPGMFQAFLSLFPSRCAGDAARLVQQCCLPFRVTDVNDRRRKVVLQSNTPLLFSGSSITTGINCVAVISIGFAIAESVGAPLGPTELLTAAAARAGYVITIDLCRDYSHIQFLKHSPAYDTHGELRAVPNLGIYLRSAWQCNGDLPGHGPLQPRAEAFQLAYLNGMYPRIRSPFIDAQKAIVAHATSSKKLDSAIQRMLTYKVESGAVNFELTTRELFRRYTTPDGVNEPMSLASCDYFCESTAHMAYGLHYADVATEVILRKDYGLGIRTGYPPHYPRN